MVRTRGTVVEPAVGRDNGSRQGDVLSAQRGVAFVEGKEYRMMLGRTAGCSGVPQDAQAYRMMLGRTAGCSERCCLGWAKKKQPAVERGLRGLEIASPGGSF